jgi:hypothetical protein
MRNNFTITLTDGTTITPDPNGGDTAPDELRIEPYGVAIYGNYAVNRRYIPWHRIADVTVGELPGGAA